VTARSEPKEGVVRVWDRFVRFAHWSLVASYFVAYVSSDVLALHAWSGYAVAAIVAARVLWGVVGPRYARFTSFVYPWSKVVAYTVALLTFRAPRYLGHSPAGGAMVVVLLVVLTLTSLSGMAALAQARGEGPLAPWLAEAVVATAWAGDDEGAGERGDTVMKSLHEALANLSLLLIAIHIAGVLFVSLVHGENLIRAMIDGTKRAANAADA